MESVKVSPWAPLALSILVGLWSCSSDEPVGSVNTTEPVSGETSNTSETGSAFVTGGDITNALASSRSGDCTTYANTYFSSVTNVFDGNSYAGEVAISVSGGKCIFASNAIPNHDMGDGGSFAHTVVAQDVTYEITTSPTMAATPTTNIWKASVALLNGGKVDILPAACYDVSAQAGDLGRVRMGLESVVEARAGTLG